ncbi:MAG: phosphoribosylanthranilate isomerase [Pseudomonadota bacterium]
MRRTRVKICCIADTEEADLAIAAGADALGLVARMPSGIGPISNAAIWRVSRGLPAGVDSFLLSSETEAAPLIAHVHRCGTRTLQIVDRVAPDVRRRLRAALPWLRIVQVVHVVDASALAEAVEVAQTADAILLDSGKPDAAVKTLGGTGDTHDWSLSARIVGACPKPVWLAGGLVPENVGNAIREVRPFGVDLCSGLRTDDRLDAHRVTRFMGAVRAADGRP